MRLFSATEEAIRAAVREVFSDRDARHHVDEMADLTRGLIPVHSGREGGREREVSWRVRLEEVSSRGSALRMRDWAPQIWQCAAHQRQGCTMAAGGQSTLLTVTEPVALSGMS